MDIFKTPEAQSNAMQAVPFKLDKKLYPDVEETPYGYVYNVGKHSITDLGGERQKIMPSHFDPNKNYGFSVTIDGDEAFYPSFEEAYKMIKGM